MIQTSFNQDDLFQVTIQSIGCENPTIIRNSNGDDIKVNCGKCKYCRLHKADINKNNIDIEASQHKYCFFGTLTYSNVFIPKLVFIPHYKTDDALLYQVRTSFIPGKNCTQKFPSLAYFPLGSIEYFKETI